MPRKRSDTFDVDRRLEIVDAAARVFQRVGYASAKVQDVAEELGLLKGSLYYYIKSKEDLLTWLYEEVHRSTDPLLESAISRADLPPLDRLFLYVESQTASAITSMDQIAVYYRDMRSLSPERQRELADLRRPHQRFVLDMLKQAQDAGLVDPEADPWTLMSLVFSIIISVYRWYPHHHSADPSFAERAAHACALFAIRGVSPSFSPAADETSEGSPVAGTDADRPDDRSLDHDLAVQRSEPG